jgi:hypothetical protein
MEDGKWKMVERVDSPGFFNLPFTIFHLYPDRHLPAACQA